MISFSGTHFSAIDKWETNLNWKTSILLTFAILSILGCSSVNKRTLIGAAIGGTIGTVIGHQQQNQAAGLVAGAAIGSFIGSASAQNASSAKSKQTSEPNFEPDAPKLLSPKVRRIWVPARIEGEKYFEGHYMYVIEKQTTWSN